MIPAWIIGHWRLTLALVLTAALGAYIAVLRLERDHYRSKYENEHAAFTAFVERVRMQGEEAEREVAAKTAADKLAKEKADAETTAALATLAGSIGKLRDERDRARRYQLSASASASENPNRTCFDTAKLNRALRDLDEGVLGIAETGSEAVIRLDAAKAWAKTLKMSP